jgi:DNA-directed RNA polymerase specialized sigma24 family protein
MDNVLARVRLEQWQAERTSLRCGRVKDYTARGRQPAEPRTNRFDAALTRCIDFEREFGKLTGDQQTLLLLAYRERQPYRVISQITNWSETAIGYKIPAALAALAALLDRANLL